ncbi:hypothetical protein Scep_005048 [Stephania cephalantha]|uniref:Uncharacterized protein n=1 Tax=Stephania cephalantha TaxID=152367 RepID=A0AAP0KWH4_9MAGN
MNNILLNKCVHILCQPLLRLQPLHFSPSSAAGTTSSPPAPSRSKSVPTRTSNS